jgi:4'-phosphopantetheinyl transferase EntD
MVLERLTSNMQSVVNARPKRKLQSGEVRSVAKAVLERLRDLHALGIAHTDRGIAMHPLQHALL